MLHYAILLAVLPALMLLACSQTSAQMAKDRPRVLIDAAELARLRDELKISPRKHSIYNGGQPNSWGLTGGVKPIADYWRKRDVTIPARGGHYHHFFCECGAILEIPPDRLPRASYNCTVCDRKYSGERYDGAVRTIRHYQLSVAAFSTALAGSVESDRELLAKSAEILLKYADAYLGPHTSNLEGGMVLQSLDESVCAIPLAAAYDLLLGSASLTPEQAEQVRSRLLRPMGGGLAKAGTGGNWGSWHLSAAGVIGYATDDAELVNFAVRAFKAQISEQLGSDGLWPESVHTYHFYPLGAFIYLAEAARHNGEDLWGYQAGDKKSLRAMFTEPLKYAYPDMRLPAINDGWFESFLPLDQYEVANARYHYAAMGWVVSQGYTMRKTQPAGLWALLQGDPNPPSVPEPELQSATFPVLGIATLRSRGGAMMTFDYGPFLGHGQLDKMGITLYAWGRLLAADYGTVGYGSPIIGWYTGTFSHNTVVVDGKLQERTKENLCKSELRLGDLEAVTSQTLQAYPGVTHTRTAARVGEAFVVVDDLDSEQEHTYDNYFHCEGELTIKCAGTPTAGHDQYLDQNISLKEAIGSEGDWTASWQAGSVALDVISPLVQPSTLVKTTCPGRDANHKVALLIERKAGKRVRFVRVLVPGPVSAKPRVSVRQIGGAAVVTLEGAGFTDRLRFESSDGPAAARPAYTLTRLEKPQGRRQTIVINADGARAQGDK